MQVPPIPLGLSSWLPIFELAVVLSIVVSVLVAVRLSDTEPYTALRSRLLFGVPWGTVIIGACLVGVYLFVQDGLNHWTRPTAIPFRSWSYFSPVGTLLSPFAHADFSHVSANLIGLVTIGVLAEYVWGHFSTADTRIQGPVRRIGVFVLVAAFLGLLSGLFSLGPSIGFSGVIFAAIGFTLMRYPLGSVLVLLSGQVISLVWKALMYPAITETGHSAFVTPWWAGISIQGHAFGMITGAFIGVLLMRYRDEHPGSFRLFCGAILVTVYEGLWAIYIPQGGSRYVLLRALGVSAMFLFVALVTIAMQRRESSFIPDRIPILDRAGVHSRSVAFALIGIGVVLLAAVAVPYNLFSISGDVYGNGITPENSLQVGDYTIAYAEDVPDQYMQSVTIPGWGRATQTSASGVIVISEQREIWWQEISKSRLSFSNRVGVPIGGIGWRETVYANRDGWNVVGNHSVYTVQLAYGNRGKLAFVSQPSKAEPTIDGRNVTLIGGESFSVRVTRNGSTLGTTKLPAAGSETETGGLTFIRKNDKLFAKINRTRVRVASFDQSSGNSS